MCFTVNTKAKRPRLRTVWKVVKLHVNGALRSEIARTTLCYNYPGSIIKRTPRQAPTSTSGFASNRVLAQSGIYVYLSKSYAVKRTYPAWTFDGAGLVLLKLEVDPADWLHTSDDGVMATYDKVTVAESQPAIEWF